MERKGWSHISLGTHDMDATKRFYEQVLGFPAVRCDRIRVKEGGTLRHTFFDTGAGQFLAFVEARQVPGLPSAYDTGVNAGLGVPPMIYHFSFEAGTPEALEARRAALEAKGVPVSPIVDHDWCQSIYFKDPNGLLLEFCCVTRALGEDDAREQERFEWSLAEIDAASALLDKPADGAAPARAA